MNGFPFYNGHQRLKHRLDCSRRPNGKAPYCFLALVDVTDPTPRPVLQGR